jgi:hypothetical protein
MKIVSFLLPLMILLGFTHLSAQPSVNRVVEVDGVVTTIDSLRAVPGAVIVVKNQNRGVESTLRGVFSIVCFAGDTLQFSCLGFRPKEYVVPKNYTSDRLSMVQLMVQDTFYLPESIIHPLPSREVFGYAFTHWRIPDDYYEMARKNNTAYALRTLAFTVPRDGRESQAYAQAQMARDAVYYGAQKPMNIFSPIAWGQFFEAWKRGDFRTQESPYYSGNY